MGRPRRIEELSRVEHDILQEVHPEVAEIREAVSEVTQDLMDVRRDNVAQAVMAEEVVEKITRVEERIVSAAGNGAAPSPK